MSGRGRLCWPVSRISVPSWNAARPIRVLAYIVLVAEDDLSSAIVVVLITTCFMPVACENGEGASLNYFAQTEDYQT
jgi:hypothetical protein